MTTATKEVRNKTACENAHEVCTAVVERLRAAGLTAEYRDDSIQHLILVTTRSFNRITISIISPEGDVSLAAESIKGQRTEDITYRLHPTRQWAQISFSIFSDDDSVAKAKDGITKNLLELFT